MTESSQNLRTSFSSGTILRFFMIGAAILLLFYIRDVVLLVLASVIIASAVEPVVRRLQRLRMHRVVAAILVYLFIALFIGAVLVFFVPAVVGDLITFLRNLPETISIESLWAPVENMGLNVGTTAIAPGSISVADFIAGLQSIVVGSSAGAFQAAALLFGGFFGLILILVLSFYLSVQEEGVADFLRIITPVKHHEYIIGLWKRSQRKIGYWLQGQLLLGVVVGILVYLVLLIVGIKHALLLAILAAIFEIIPVLGPVIAAIPAVLIAYQDIGVGTALLLIGLYIIIQQFESHLFYPLVVKKIVGISPIVVILALVVGAKLAGILGALIAVPLSAVLMEYVYDIDKDKKALIAERKAVQKT